MVVSLDPASRSKAEDHAKRDAPLEACGLLVTINGEQIYCPCRNLCDEPDQHFVMDPRDYYRASLNGKIIAIIHSHPKGQDSSGLDRMACTQSNVPWFIYQLPQDQWLTIEP